jgi:hypothetical protein
MFILRFLVYTNLLISAVTATVSFGWATYLGSYEADLYAIVTFGATLFTYNLHRILRSKDRQNNYSHRHTWILQNPIILYVLAAIGLGLCSTIYFIYFIDFKSSIILAAVGVISITYAWRIKVHRKTLRELPYVKIYLIALSWVLVCIVWPIVQEEKNITDYWLIISASYLYIFAATIPFDIRDYPFDSPEQRTIPHIIGERNSLLVGVLALLLSYLQLSSYTNFSMNNLLFVIAYLGMLVLLVFTRQKNHELYFSLVIDGWIILFGCGLYFL